MTSLRHFFLRHRAFAVWLVAAALVMKVLMPAGFMASASQGAMTIELCSGYGPQTVTVAILGADERHAPAQHDKSDMPCAFSGLAATSLAAADPIILAIAIAFIIATAFRTAPIHVARAPARLRPPLRGPPLTA